MPYNNPTFHKILDKMDMTVLDILNESEIKKAIKKNAFGQKKDEAWILCFHRFALPNKFNGIEVNHATVLYDTRDTIKLVVPAYNRKFEYNKDTIFEYKDWKEILKREPVYAIKITRRSATNPETKRSILSKFKIFWL